jgi:hypothetical protein
VLTSPKFILGTPTLPAVEGALAFAGDLLKKDPGTKVALVLVTDGEPAGCTGNTVSTVAQAVGAQAATTPTYVIGIGSTSNLDAIAKAGGTGSAFIVSTTSPAQTASDFQTALGAIRGSSVSCSYTLPPAPSGQVLDLQKVNVVYTPGQGAPDTLLYDQGCSGGGTGWQYDDPSKPTEIELCAASCKTVQADTGASVDVELGCATRSQ